MRRWVLLGTGTDVGKTYVATRLAQVLRARHTPCLALKPIESGVSLLAGDAGTLRAAATAGAAPHYAFSDPISPHLAARRAGQTIHIEAVLAFVAEHEARFEQSLASPTDPRSALPVCLIETAGGAFSPLNEQCTNWDLAHALRPEVLILVAPDSLGVLHDVQATLRALRPAVPDVLVISEARPIDASTGSNLSEIEQVVLPQLGLLGKLPLVHCGRDEDLDLSALGPLLHEFRG